MKPLTFKAAWRRSDDRWTVIVVDTGASALPAFFEMKGIEPEEAALLAAFLNSLIKPEARVGDGKTWKAG